ncbi:hypothetical protein A3197_19230 [Candidatus Thiodiazotropha endoloripes]|nr:hypothetical protein A3197_19230 [Candidatus Thiodiazotropha endoloripes]
MSLGLKMNDLFQQNSLNLTEKRNYHYRKGVEEVENALCHELIVLLQILQTRISDRQNWKDSRYRAQRPEFLPMPNNPWGREILAVERILRGLELRYGG